MKLAARFPLQQQPFLLKGFFTLCSFYLLWVSEAFGQTPETEPNHDCSTANQITSFGTYTTSMA